LRAKALFLSSYRPRSQRILSAGLSLIIIGEHKANLEQYLCMTSMNSTPASDVEHLLRGGSARLCKRPLDCFARSRMRVRLTFNSLWRPIYKITPALHLRGLLSGTPLQNTSRLADTAMPDERDDVIRCWLQCYAATLQRYAATLGDRLQGCPGHPFHSNPATCFRRFPPVGQELISQFLKSPISGRACNPDG
jgi:hypothetical protein